MAQQKGCEIRVYQPKVAHAGPFLVLSIRLGRAGTAERAPSVFSPPLRQIFMSGQCGSGRTENTFLRFGCLHSHLALGSNRYAATSAPQSFRPCSNSRWAACPQTLSKSVGALSAAGEGSATGAKAKTSFKPCKFFKCACFKAGGSCQFVAGGASIH